MDKIPQNKHSDIARRRQDGETLQSIANTYSCSRERVRQIIRDEFPWIKAKDIHILRRKRINKGEAQKTQLCACGCGAVIPVRMKNKQGYWCNAPRYVPGHIDPTRREEVRNRINRPEHKAKTIAAVKRGWKEGKYKSVGRYWRSEEIISKFKSFVKSNPGCALYKVYRETGISPSAVGRLAEEFCHIEKILSGKTWRYAIYLKEDA